MPTQPKMPFSKVAKILTTQFTTGGQMSKDAPGPTKTAKGVMAPDSAVQKADPTEALRVIKQPRKSVIVVTPFVAEDPAKAAMMQRYSLRCFRDALGKTEAPLVTNAMFGDLNFRNPIERDLGLQTQLAWMKAADLVAFYVDFGMTPAMEVVMNAAKLKQKRIEQRLIGAVA